MKQSAIIRIVCYSLVFLVLLGLMLAGMGAGGFLFHFPTDREEHTGSGSVAASDAHSLKIDWTSGKILIRTGDTDQILLEESGTFNEREAMTYKCHSGVLSVALHSDGFYHSLPKKDLTVTVPRDWNCLELELDGAAMDVEIQGLTVEKLDIDGAACDLEFDGTVSTVDCDGAACSIILRCVGRPGKIDLDGASCSLELTLPKDCGFRAEVDGLGYRFRSDLAYTKDDRSYRYGDGYCVIQADGLSCELTVQQAQ